MAPRPDSGVVWLEQDHNQVTNDLPMDLQVQFLHYQLHFLPQDSDILSPCQEEMMGMLLYAQVHKRPCLDDSLATEELVGHTPLFPLERFVVTDPRILMTFLQ